MNVAPVPSCSVCGSAHVVARSRVVSDYVFCDFCHRNYAQSATEAWPPAELMPSEPEDGPYLYVAREVSDPEDWDDRVERLTAEREMKEDR
jgi:hypothetical protein